MSIRFVLNALKCLKGKQKRIVHQMHYTSWPDRSIPHDVTTLVVFWHRVTSLQRNMNGPIVVHCRLKILDYAFRNWLYCIPFSNPNLHAIPLTTKGIFVSQDVFHFQIVLYFWVWSKKGNHHILHFTVPKCGYRANGDIYCPGHPHQRGSRLGPNRRARMCSQHASEQTKHDTDTGTVSHCIRSHYQIVITLYLVACKYNML